MFRFEYHGPEGITVNNGTEELHFNSTEEYQDWKIKQASTVPILCNYCIYCLQKNKKKFKCPLGTEFTPLKVIQCSHYWKNPESLRDWIKWYKLQLIGRYWYYRRKIERKYRIGFYKTHRKRFIFWPTWKEPFFTFVKRLRNEYYDECRVRCFGWISKANSSCGQAGVFEEITTTAIPGVHINYEYAKCTEDYFVTTINNFRTLDSYFKCRKGETYHVRHVAKYKYYDILYMEDDMCCIKGQIPEADFKKYFEINTPSTEPEDNKEK